MRPPSAPEDYTQQAERAVGELQGLLERQRDPRLREVRLWVKRINPERGILFVGAALGKALGCSPFCGCAARQLGERVEPFLLERLPWMTRLVVEPEAPSDEGPEQVLLRLSPRGGPR